MRWKFIFASLSLLVCLSVCPTSLSLFISLRLSFSLSLSAPPSLLPSCARRWGTFAGAAIFSKATTVSYHLLPRALCLRFRPLGWQAFHYSGKSIHILLLVLITPGKLVLLLRAWLPQGWQLSSAFLHGDGVEHWAGWGGRMKRVPWHAWGTVS